jgi:hypothetical protein
MPDEPPNQDLKGIWQNQSTERNFMTIEFIEAKGRELRAKTRRKLFGTLTGPAATAFLYAFAVKQFPALEPALHVLFAFALVWSIVGLYFLMRGMWPSTMPADGGLSTGLEFCRGEIERQNQILRRVLLLSFGPVLLSLAAFVLALARVGRGNRALFPNAIPFLALVIVWILGYFAARLREQRELKRELDELSVFQGENSR